jgi:hypothetical protein
MWQTEGSLYFIAYRIKLSDNITFRLPFLGLYRENGGREKKKAKIKTSLAAISNVFNVAAREEEKEKCF